MTRWNWIRGAAVAMATVGMVIPDTNVIAGPSRPAVRTVNARVFDIALSDGGTFKGRVVDHTGTPIEGAEVMIKQDNRAVSRVVTDKAGTFAASNLTSGQYSVVSGNTEGTYRMWTAQTAPPTAKEQGLLVMGENGARGNFGYVDGTVLVIGAVAVAALAVGIVALVRADQAKNNNNIPVSP